MGGNMYLKNWVILPLFIVLLLPLVQAYGSSTIQSYSGSHFESGDHSLERILVSTRINNEYFPTVRPGDELLVHVQLTNNFNEDIDDLSIKAYMLAYVGETWSTYRSDIEETRHSAILRMKVPEYAKPGMELVKIRLQNHPDGNNDPKIRESRFVPVMII